MQASTPAHCTEQAGLASRVRLGSAARTHRKLARALDWRLVRQRARRRNGPVSRRTCTARPAQSGLAVDNRALCRTPRPRPAQPRPSHSQTAGHACRNFSWRGQGRGRGQHAHGRVCREALRSPLKTVLKHARVPGCCPPCSPNGSPSSRLHTSPHKKLSPPVFSFPHGQSSKGKLKYYIII